MDTQQRKTKLYTRNNKESKKAAELLSDAGIQYEEVEVSPSHNIEVRYGTPVVYGLNTHFPGMERIKVFVDNYTFLNSNGDS